METVQPVVLVVQHQDSCPPALVGEWLTGAGLRLDVRRPDRGEALPSDLDGHDALLVLGGAMDAVDEAGHPWLRETVALLALAVSRDLPTWGICLGHQLLARACGGVVDRNPRGRQLGVLALGWTAAAIADDLFGEVAASGRASCLQWNQDIVVALPSQAVTLAETAAHEPQVVRFAASAWGIQAHPEADSAIAALWAAEAAAEERESVDTSTAEAAVAAVAAEGPTLRATWRPVARRFADLVLDRAPR